MNILKLLITSIILSSTLYGQETFYESDRWENYKESSICYQEGGWSKFLVETQIAAFFPLDSKVSRIYGSALPAFSLEGNWQYECWDVWLNCSYIFGNGHSIGPGRNKTHLSLVPITFGLKYVHSICDATDFYIGLGGCYSFLNTKDHSKFVHKNISSNAFGAIAKIGILYNFCGNFFINGFLNYTYQRFTFSRTKSDPFVYRHNANLDSLQFGLGLGIKF